MKIEIGASRGEIKDAHLAAVDMAKTANKLHTRCSWVVSASSRGFKIYRFQFVVDEKILLHMIFDMIIGAVLQVLKHVLLRQRCTLSLQQLLQIPWPPQIMQNEMKNNRRRRSASCAGGERE
jgi:hypothetical protein